MIGKLSDVRFTTSEVSLTNGPPGGSLLRVVLTAAGDHGLMRKLYEYLGYGQKITLGGDLTDAVLHVVQEELFEVQAQNVRLKDLVDELREELAQR